MTCEVAVLNKHAVVIAADSAVTYSNGADEKRYSKGGNKIFQLSHHQPVGVMIYDSGSFLGIPWEIIIKEYRNNHGRKSFDTVSDYGADFISFLSGRNDFLTDEDRINNFFEVVSAALIHILFEATNRQPILKDISADTEERSSAWLAFLEQKQAQLDASEFLQEIDVEQCKDYQALAREKLKNEAKSIATGVTDNGSANVKDVIEIAQWIDIATEASLKHYSAFSSNTGFVFSGYGNKQYFPELVEHKVSGYIGSLLVSTNSPSTIISRSRESHIQQFAMTSMVDVFTLGYGSAIFEAVQTAFSTHVTELATQIVAAIAPQAHFDPDPLIQEAKAHFREGWTGKLLKNNYVNLRRNIGTLPIDEMVHLAETMIVLESLKEKVTAPSQSVGGPVDIAVITKAEGLVWVKRKEFFSLNQNPRYAARHQQIYQ